MRPVQSSRRRRYGVKVTTREKFVLAFYRALEHRRERVAIDALLSYALSGDPALLEFEAAGIRGGSCRHIFEFRDARKGIVGVAWPPAKNGAR